MKTYKQYLPIFGQCLPSLSDATSQCLKQDWGFLLSTFFLRLELILTWEYKVRLFLAFALCYQDFFALFLEKEVVSAGRRWIRVRCYEERPFDAIWSDAKQLRSEPIIGTSARFSMGVASTSMQHFEFIPLLVFADKRYQHETYLRGLFGISLGFFERGLRP